MVIPWTGEFDVRGIVTLVCCSHRDRNATWSGGGGHRSGRGDAGNDGRTPPDLGTRLNASWVAGRVGSPSGGLCDDGKRGSPSRSGWPEARGSAVTWRVDQGLG